MNHDTVEKINILKKEGFNEIHKTIHPDQLLKLYGGNLDMPAVYWPPKNTLPPDASPEVDPKSIAENFYFPDKHNRPNIIEPLQPHTDKGANREVEFSLADIVASEGNILKNLSQQYRVPTLHDKTNYIEQGIIDKEKSSKQQQNSTKKVNAEDEENLFLDDDVIREQLLIEQQIKAQNERKHKSSQPHNKHSHEGRSNPKPKDKIPEKQKPKACCLLI